MDNPKTEVINSIKEAQNVLVTVSKNPSVDQLAAAIGMTLVLNKLGKHGTAVFSGAVPSTIEFLKPEQTLEKNTDSLRDFIISLDKAKADKLRYKVEDQHVKIFITPYRTTLGESDLVFSHGDFNVDVVLALGVHEQNELDQAITAHGRILHDAKIISVNVERPGELGGINLNEQNVSSLSEVMAQMSLTIQKDVFDQQIATALLTGIVAETERFSNEKTKPETMSISAKLMAAGANQQLVATQLQVVPEPPTEPLHEAAAPTDPGTTESEDSVKHNDGSLEIKHQNPPQDEPPKEDQDSHAIHVDEEGNFKSALTDELPAVHKESKTEPNEQTSNDETNEVKKSKRMILQPPASSSKLTASGTEEQEEYSDPLSHPDDHKGPILSHDKDKKEQPSESETEPAAKQAPSKTAGSKAEGKSSPREETSAQTLDTLEKSVDSPHQQKDKTTQSGEPKLPESPPEPKEASAVAPDIGELQNAVDKALANSGDQEPLEPIEALNANPVDLNLGHEDAPETENSDGYLDVSKLDETNGDTNDPQPADEPKPKFPPEPKPGHTTDAASPTSPPPPVPPPMMPPVSNNSDDDLSLPPINQ